MIETYALADDGTMIVTLEAETPEEMAGLAELARAGDAEPTGEHAPVVVAVSAAHTDLGVEVAGIRRQERARAAAIVRAWLAPPGADLAPDAADLIRRIHGEQP